ncbi:MAG: hypothetical protein IKR04_03250 [Clostridia bacterium]|nr:hypothetical protein [Clostridia bacterium]
MKTSKRIVSGVLAITLLLPNLPSATFASDDKVILNKKESVYINSDVYGNPTKVNIYNNFDISNVDEVKDYGVYDKYQILTGNNTPIISGDSILFKVDKGDKSFSYIGSSSIEYAKKAPWSFEIKYYLNGKETLAQDLIHQKGLVKVEIHVIPNEGAPEYYKNNYMMEIQSNFDMTEYISVESDEAIESTVGNTKTLTFMILPGQEKTVSIELGTDDFYMDGLTIGMVPLVGDIQEVIQDLVDDRKKIKDAFQELNSSFDVILNSLSDSGKNIDEVISGLNGFEDSLDLINNGKDTRSQSIAGISETLESISGDFTNIDNNVTTIINEIAYLKTRVNETKTTLNNLNKELKSLSNNLEQNEKDLDRIQKRSEGVNKDLKTLKNVIASTKNSIGGLNKLLGNVDSVSDIDLKAVKNGLTDIASDAQELGEVAGEIAAVDPSLAMEVGGIAKDIGSNLTKVSNEMKKAEDLMGDTNKNTSSLSKSLKDLQGDLIDLYEVADKYEDYSKNLPDTIKNANNTIKTINSMIDIVTKQLDDKLSTDTMELNEALDNLSILLNNIQVLEKNLKKIYSITQDLLTLAQNDLNTISNDMHTSTKATLDSTKGLMTTLKGATNQSIPLKNAKNKIYNTIKEESDDIENETNIFNMDPNADPVSFASEKNENVERVQIYVQTEAIKEFNFKDTADLEPEHEKVGFWDKLVQVFQKIGDFFKNLFGIK